MIVSADAGNWEKMINFGVSIATGMRKRAGDILKFFLPVLFAGYIGVLSFYVHVHVVNGEAMVHSHPFRNLPGQPFHGHTTADFWLVHNLSSYSVTPDVVPHFEWEAHWTEFHSDACHRNFVRIAAVIPGALYLRAPPAAA